MFKKILIPFVMIAIYAMPLNGQPVHVSVSFQSLRPYIHFQLNFGRNMSHTPYRTAYLKGYMAGVSSRYGYGYRFEEMIENMQIYKAGYRDGMRDRALLIRLRSRGWLRRHCFNYEDYYTPYVSVRIWLENVSIAFSNAPVRRLPPGWSRRAYPHGRRYRPRIRHPRRWNRRWPRYEDYEDYYEDRFEEYYEEYEEEFDD